jgi:hypothetical protein
MQLPRPRRLRRGIVVLLAAVTIAASQAGFGPYGHSSGHTAAVASAQNVVAVAPHAGIDASERSRGTASRQTRALRLRQQHEQQAQSDLRDAWRALELVGSHRVAGRHVFYAPAVLARRLLAYSTANFDRLSLLGYSLVKDRPTPGFYGGGDMNALSLDRDSTPEHVVAYLDTQDYEVYELDAFPGKAALITNPFARGSGKTTAAGIAGISLAQLALDAAYALAALYLLLALRFALRRSWRPLGKRRRARSLRQSWQEWVTVGQGPEEPQLGWLVLVPRKERSQQGDDVLIDFRAEALVWTVDGWTSSNCYGGREPAQGLKTRWSSADDRLEEIVEGWIDFSASLAVENTRRYREERERSLQAEIEGERRARELQERWQVAELLPENAVRGLL